MCNNNQNGYKVLVKQYSDKTIHKGSRAKHFYTNSQFNSAKKNFNQNLMYNLFQVFQENSKKKLYSLVLDYFL